MPISTLPAAAPRVELAARFDEVRAHTLALAAPLSAEDQCVQSMPDASPVKWHLAHTSWFFEAVVLVPHMAGYRAFNDRFFYLFNSYYEALGPRHARPQRGLLTRPSLAEVHAGSKLAGMGDRGWEYVLRHFNRRQIAGDFWSFAGCAEEEAG